MDRLFTQLSGLNHATCAIEALSGEIVTGNHDVEAAGIEPREAQLVIAIDLPEQRPTRGALREPYDIVPRFSAARSLGRLVERP